MNVPADQAARLSAFERIAIVVACLAAVGFGALVVIRSAGQRERKTDLDVFCRAAWAIRAGQDPYTTWSDRAWNYIYPPLFAVAMTPLADPPSARTFDRIAYTRELAGKRLGLDAGWLIADRERIMARRDRLAARDALADEDGSRAGYVPFWVSCVLWYALSLAMTVLSAHWLAQTLERTVLRLPDGWRWRGTSAGWALRIWPIVFCAPAIFNGFSRGQSNALVLLAIAGCARWAVRDRRVASGISLALAGSIKVFPGLLAVLPFWRGDRRMIVGVIAGVALWMAVIPALALGPEQAWRCTLSWARATLLPGLGLAGPDADPIQTAEVRELGSANNQSIVAVLHRWFTPPSASGEIPTTPARWIMPVAGAFSLGMLAVTLWAIGPPWRRDPSGGSCDDLSTLPALGVLSAVMIMASPVCHIHYFGFLLPLVSWLTALAIRRDAQLRMPVWAIAIGVAYTGVHAVTRLPAPAFTFLLVNGLMLWLGAALWLYACLRLRAERLSPVSTGP